MKNRGELVEKRTKKGLHWEIYETPKIKGNVVERSSSGFQPDDCATMTLEEAESDFEKAFVEIRQVLEASESLCMDNEEDRLNLCQKLTRFTLRKMKNGQG